MVNIPLEKAPRQVLEPASGVDCPGKDKVGLLRIDRDRRLVNITDLCVLFFFVFFLLSLFFFVLFSLSNHFFLFFPYKKEIRVP